jgi:hypothetical protein
MIGGGGESLKMLQYCVKPRYKDQKTTAKWGYVYRNLITDKVSKL